MAVASEDGKWRRIIWRLWWNVPCRNQLPAHLAAALSSLRVLFSMAANRRSALDPG